MKALVGFVPRVVTVSARAIADTPIVFDDIAGDAGVADSALNGETLTMTEAD